MPTVFAENKGTDAFAADLLRGHTDTIVLGVLRRGDSSTASRSTRQGHPAGHRRRLRDQGGHTPASYRRLEKDGLAEAYWGDETQGGRRKYYRITDASRAVYGRKLAAWTATRDIIDTLLNTEDTK